MKFDSDRHETLHSDGATQLTRTGWGCLAALQERTWGLGKTRVTRDQHCTAVSRSQGRPATHWATLAKAFPAGQGADSFPHLWVDIRSTVSSFGPPEHGTFWQIEGAPKGFRVWSLWCAGRGWEGSFCLDWEEKAEKGLRAVLHYLERDYGGDAWSCLRGEQWARGSRCTLQEARSQLDKGKIIFQSCKQASTGVGCPEIMESPLCEIFGTQLHNALSNLVHAWSRPFD